MRRLLAAATLALLAGCASPSSYRNADLSGTVSYREKVVYGPDATLVVWLVDASGPESAIEVDLQKLDNPAPGTELLASSTVEGRIVSPAPFSLPVPMGKIDQSHDYRLKAAIIDQGRPVMATTNAPLVLTKGRPLQVDLEVSPIPGR
ncbi:MAG: YbaY family lipoprotein [Geminicoccaceae bacterium]